jgi:hypothetical protein
LPTPLSLLPDVKITLKGIRLAITRRDCTLCPLVVLNIYVSITVSLPSIAKISKAKKKLSQIICAGFSSLF